MYQQLYTTTHITSREALIELIDTYTDKQADSLLTQIRTLTDDYQCILMDEISEIIHELEESYQYATPSQGWYDNDLSLYLSEESAEEEEISRRISNAQEIYNLIVIA